MIWGLSEPYRWLLGGLGQFMCLLKLACTGHGLCEIVLASVQPQKLSHFGVVKPLLKLSFEGIILQLGVCRGPSFPVQSSKTLFELRNRLAFLLAAGIKTPHCSLGLICIPKSSCQGGPNLVIGVLSLFIYLP